MAAIIHAPPCPHPYLFSSSIFISLLLSLPSSLSVYLGRRPHRRRGHQRSGCNCMFCRRRWNLVCNQREAQREAHHCACRAISRARVRDGGALLHRRSSTAPCTRVSSPAADVERERQATMNATQMLDAIAMKERRRNGPAWRAFGRRSAVDAQVHVDGQLLPAVPTPCPVWHCVREKGNLLFFVL